MNFEELQQAWQQDAKAVPTPIVNEKLLRDVRALSGRFKRRIFWRDVREVAASFLVAFIFGRIAWQAAAEGSRAWPAWSSSPSHRWRRSPRWSQRSRGGSRCPLGAYGDRRCL